MKSDLVRLAVSQMMFFYIKGNDVVVAKQNNEFVTVMRGGITDGWVKNARRL